MRGGEGLGSLEALVLGVVEGLTEFLPVSSTGHLLLAERALRLPPTPALHAFTVVIQAGAILAVLGLYRDRVASAARGLLGRDPEGARLAARLLLAFLPAALLGLLLEEVIERHLFGLWPVVAAWAAGGALLVGTGARLRAGAPAGAGAPLAGLGARQALVIGCVQCLALWPGVSRSLAALLGGLLVGLSLPAAVEFSFLLGVLTLGAAAGYKALAQGGALLGEVGLGALLLGLGCAWLSAVVAVRALTRWVTTRSLTPFGWYRLALAALVAALLLGGVLPEGGGGAAPP